MDFPYPPFGWGIVGLWIDLCVGLIAVALALLHAWTQRIGALVARHPPARQVV